MRKRIITIMLILAVVLSIGAAAQLLPNARLVAQEAPPAEVQTVVQTTPCPSSLTIRTLSRTSPKWPARDGVHLSGMAHGNRGHIQKALFHLGSFGSFFDFWFSDPSTDSPWRGHPPAPVLALSLTSRALSSPTSTW